MPLRIMPPEAPGCVLAALGGGDDGFVAKRSLSKQAVNMIGRQSSDSQRHLSEGRVNQRSGLHIIVFIKAVSFRKLAAIFV